MTHISTNKTISVDKERMYKEKNAIEVLKLSGLINLKIRLLYLMFSRKLLFCKNSQSIWETFKEDTSEKHTGSDIQVNTFDLNKSFVRQSSDVMLPMSVGLKSRCVLISIETNV